MLTPQIYFRASSSPKRLCIDPIVRTAPPAAAEGENSSSSNAKLLFRIRIPREVLQRAATQGKTNSVRIRLSSAENRNRFTVDGENMQLSITDTSRLAGSGGGSSGKDSRRGYSSFTSTSSSSCENVYLNSGELSYLGPVAAGLAVQVPLPSESNDNNNDHHHKKRGLKKRKWDTVAVEADGGNNVSPPRPVFTPQQILSAYVTQKCGFSGLNGRTSTSPVREVTRSGGGGKANSNDTSPSLKSPTPPSLPRRPSPKDTRKQQPKSVQPPLHQASEVPVLPLEKSPAASAPELNRLREKLVELLKEGPKKREQLLQQLPVATGQLLELTRPLAEYSGHTFTYSLREDYEATLSEGLLRPRSVEEYLSEKHDAMESPPELQSPQRRISTTPTPDGSSGGCSLLEGLDLHPRLVDTTNDRPTTYGQCVAWQEAYKVHFRVLQDIDARLAQNYAACVEQLRLHLAAAGGGSFTALSSRSPVFQLALKRVEEVRVLRQLQAQYAAELRGIQDGVLHFRRNLRRRISRVRGEERN